jgi:preprotein translocase subunit SecG
MGILESCWFIVGFLLVTLVVLVDPKNTVMGSGNSTVLTGFSSPSSRQNFILTLSNILILVFFLLTIILGYLS